MSCHDPRSLKADAERMAEELKKEQEQRKLLEDELKADLRTLTNANAAAAAQISKLEMDWQTASDAKAVAEAGVRELREMLEQQQGKLQVDLKAAAEALAPAERQISQLRRDSDWEQQRAENARAGADRKIKELRGEGRRREGGMGRVRRRGWSERGREGEEGWGRGWRDGLHCNLPQSSQLECCVNCGVYGACVGEFVYAGG